MEQLLVLKLFLLPYFMYRVLSSFRLRPQVSGYFFPDSKISPSTRSVIKSNSPVDTHPMVSGLTVVPSSNLLRHRIRKHPNSPFYALSNSLRIYFFPPWKADLKISGFPVEFAGCVWTAGVPGKKRLRIQKYPDTCERGLISIHLP